MSEFSPESRALFGAARAELEPSDADRARVERALGARLGVALVAVTSSAAGSAGAAMAGAATGVSTLAVAAKWIGVGVLVGLGAASGYAVVGGASASKAPAARLATSNTPVSRTAPPPAPLSAPLAEAPSALPRAVAPNSAKAVAAVELHEKSDAAAPPTPPGHVGEEAALLRKADEALRTGDAKRALELLREHAARFPAGILSEERSAELVTTLCRLGRTSEARREAERFLRVTPSSPLASSVRSSCGAPEAVPAR